MAAEGVFPGIASRPAKAGDYLELYANGLGATASPYPVGQVLAKPYRLGSRGRSKGNHRRRSAPVPGCQLDLCRPVSGQRASAGWGCGNQPVILSINDHTTQEAFLTIAAN